MASLELTLLIAALLLLLSVAASKLSTRLSVPTLLLFLGIGMLAGSEGLGRIEFTDAQLVQSVGVVALIFILFSGGLDTPFNAIRPVLGRGVLLATVGVVVTAGLVALFARLLLGWSVVLALLLGAIVSSTDAAAVFSIFRTQRVGLKGNTIALLELESGSNDPMAIFLTIATITLVTMPGTAWWALAGLLVRQALVGGVLGWGLGWLAGRLINNLRLEAVGLYPIATIALVLLSYSLTDLLGGSGFLAVYLVGLQLSRQNIVHKSSVSRFHDSVAWLMQIVMFLVLGLLVFPSQLVAIAPVGMVLALMLIVLARPVGVFVALAGSDFSLRDQLLVAWVGLRGATPIVLATFPLLAGVPGANMLFNITFFVVLSSVLLQGTTLLPVARLLGLTVPLPPKPGLRLEPTGAVPLTSELTEIVVPSASAVVGRQVVDLKLPADLLIVLLERNGEVIVPHGGTTLEADDHLLLLADKPSLQMFHALVDAKREATQPVPQTE